MAWSLIIGIGNFSTVAQPLSNMVFSVGTTLQDASLQNWSYLLIGAPAPELLAGKQFAVFGKNGVAASNAAFTQRGIIFQQTDPTAINALLNQSVALGDDLSGLSSALNVVFRKVPGITNQSLPQKVLTAFQTSASDPSLSGELLVLERLHPGLARCAGQAFAEIISTTTTYEVREVNPATGAAGDVVGRVTITPGSPVVLPAPGFPFQVTTNAPSDHLRIRLRWGTPATLRRLSLLQFGFNVWRIPAAAALAGNFQITPPTINQLHANGNFTLVNSFPVMAATDYVPLAGPGGPDDPTDRTTYFFSDSNGRSPGNVQFPAGTTPPGYLAPPFNDGDQFYYFVTARDILGRDGLVSPGGLAIACRKNPPSAPTKLSVLNTTQVTPVSGGFTNQEHLLVSWLQNTNISDQVTQYWVYRWTNPAMALTNDAAPLFSRVGTVAHVAGTNFGSLLDTNAGSPAVPGASNYWYTVRAMSASACGPLLSPNSAPASGVLRQRAAPPATTGELVGSCGTPVVMFQNFNLLANPNGPDTNNWNYRITVTRRDSGIAWVQILASTAFNNSTQSFGPIYFPPDGNSVSVDVNMPASGSSEFDVSCLAGTYYGRVSQAALCTSTTPPSTSQIKEAVFQTGELLFTALSSSDPFLQAVNNNQSSCYPANNVVRDPSGTVRMTFNNGGVGPMLIQYATNLNAVTFWTDIGVATPDTNGVYSVYLCPCVVSPVPTLRGCTVNIPDEGNCEQHIARAGDSGAVAPIYARFRLTPRTHEYRLYRSVNGGEPTLIAQAAALYDPLNPGREVVRTDDAMPPSAARLCYFVQTLDENGNGSPLALLGCKDVPPPKPPRPVLSEPAPTGSVTNPLVALNWFCPTAGVYRFEVRIHRADQGSGTTKPTGFASVKLLKLPFINVNAKFLGLFADRKLISAPEEWQVTPPISPNFGPGPQFSLTANVLPNVPYEISVGAEDYQGHWGDASTAWKFTWKPPPTLQTVPWPARPLPPVTLFDEPASLPLSVPYGPRVSAVMFVTNGVHGFSSTPDRRYPVAIRIAEIPQGNQITINIGNTNFASYSFFGAVTFSLPGLDPNGDLFKRYSSGNGALQNGQSLLPIVVYRKQETNAAFPQVSGNLTQVTPLLEKVPWIAGGSPFNFVTATIPDRLIAIWQEDWNDHDFTFLGLRDQQPVVAGARYHYYVVRFNEQREASETIDAGTVEIPLN